MTWCPYYFAHSLRTFLTYICVRVCCMCLDIFILFFFFDYHLCDFLVIYKFFFQLQKMTFLFVVELKSDVQTPKE